MAIYTAMIIQLWEIRSESMLQAGLFDFGSLWSPFLNFSLDIHMIKKEVLFLSARKTNMIK